MDCFVMQSSLRNIIRTTNLLMITPDASPPIAVPMLEGMIKVAAVALDAFLVRM